MATNYGDILAVGQSDPTACWAACLCWWQQAVNNTTMPQYEIATLFGKESPVCQPDGQIMVDALREKLTVNCAVFKMFTNIVPFANLATYMSDGLPIMVGFKTQKGNGHMNIIYDFDSKTQKVKAMEPWYPDLKLNQTKDGIYYNNPGEQFTGKHEPRDLSYYMNPLKSLNGIFVGFRHLTGVAALGNRSSSGEGKASSSFW